MKKGSICIITLVLLYGCSANHERHFLEREGDFKQIIKILKNSAYDFESGRSIDIVNCIDYQRELPSDSCDDRLSQLLHNLNLKRIRLITTTCNSGQSLFYEVNFMYSKLSTSPTSFIVYDECDELTKDESDFVQIKKIKPKLYLKTDNNFP
jgi:hypothetical protein